MAIRDQMAANAAPLLKPDEKIQAVFGAQTVSQYLSLISYWIIIVKNAYRVVVVTDQRILICRSGRFRTTPVSEVLAELPRATRIGVSHPLARCRISASPIRTCGTVNAGAIFFPPTGLDDQEPRRDHRQRHVVVPTAPVPHLVLAQPRLALGPLQALLDPVLRLRHAGELR